MLLRQIAFQFHPGNLAHHPSLVKRDILRMPPHYKVLKEVQERIPQPQVLASLKRKDHLPRCHPRPAGTAQSERMELALFMKTIKMVMAMCMILK